MIRHSSDQCLYHFMLRLDKFFYGNNLLGHALKAVAVFIRKVFDAARQHFTHRAIVAKQINNERFAKFIAQALMGKQTPHIEKVARMLAVQRGNKLARKKVFE